MTCPPRPETTLRTTSVTSGPKTLRLRRTRHWTFRRRTMSPNGLPKGGTCARPSWMRRPIPARRTTPAPHTIPGRRPMRLSFRTGSRAVLRTAVVVATPPGTASEASLWAPAAQVGRCARTALRPEHAAKGRAQPRRPMLALRRCAWSVSARTTACRSCKASAARPTRRAGASGRCSRLACKRRLVALPTRGRVTLRR
jgi:hypothetical protein